MPRQDPFGDIIGHETALLCLRRTLEWQSFGQALLFVGPRSVGKTTIAERFSQALLGVEELSTHPDFERVRRDVDPKTGVLHKEITIEQIRGLRTRLRLSSFLNSWKVAIIDDAELLSLGAANALLKTLEEPAPRTMVILAAHREDALPQTVRSRCQVIRFRLVPEGYLRRALESRGLSRPDAARYAALGSGRPGRAIALAERESDRAEWNGAATSGERLITGKLYERFRIIESLFAAKIPQNEQVEVALRVLGVWRTILEQAFKVSIGLRSSVEAAPSVTAWARGTDPAQIAFSLEQTLTIPTLLKKNVNPRLCLEQFAVSIA